jgi:hypothetical protein
MRYYLRYLCDGYILADAFRPIPHWGAKRYTVEAAPLGEHTDADIIKAAQDTAPDGYWLQHIEAIGGEPHVRDVFKKAVPRSRSAQAREQDQQTAAGSTQTGGPANAEVTGNARR